MQRLRRFSSAAAARHLADCRASACQRTVRAGGADWPTTLGEAYETQRELQRLLEEEAGSRLVGHKVGCTTPVMQDYLDVPHPCAGGVYSTGLWRADASGTSLAVSAQRYARLGVECELAVVLGEPLPAGGCTLERASSAVGSVHAAVEMVDDRYEDFAARKPPLLAWVADDFFHCGLALSAPLRVAPLDLDAVLGTMWCGAEPVGEGRGADIIDGHPLHSLTWLANSEVAAARGGLPRGWVVSLGSVTRTAWVPPPSSGEATTVRVEFTDGAAPERGGAPEVLGTLELRLVNGSCR